MKAGLFDIDGTLIKHKDGRKTAVKSLKNLAHLTTCAKGFETIVLTARSSEARKETINTLNSMEMCFDKLIMRSKEDMSKPDYKFKREKIRDLRENGYNIYYAVEDRRRVAKMLEDQGIRCLKMPEKHKVRHRFLDYIRRIYPYMPDPVKNAYLTQYNKRFKHEELS